MTTIVLLGYMGSGKSVIGKQLAIRLNSEFKDLDALIELEENKTITELFNAKGEIYFRKREANLLKEVLNLKERQVVSLGGGTPCYGDTMQTILSQKNTFSIYLKQSVKALGDRLYLGKASRPLIAHLANKAELLDFIRKHLFERSYYYSQSNVTINCDKKTVDDVVDEILAILK